MDFFMIVSLLGGLALFLYGMSMLGSGLEKLSGGRLEQTLEKLTNNVFKGVLLGALVTGAIQSSSATTVIVVGLVNARILKLRQAIGIIMGANIGTTVTAHILRLSDLSSDNFFLMLLKPTTLAPVVGIIGILMVMVGKKQKYKTLGEILLGFCILFTGMFNMEAAVSPLSESAAVCRPVCLLLQSCHRCSGGCRRHCHYPVLFGFHRYPAGSQLHRHHHLVVGNSDHSRSEHRHLHYPYPCLHRCLQKRQAHRCGASVLQHHRHLVFS